MKNPLSTVLHSLVLLYALNQYMLANTKDVIFIVFLGYLAATSLLKEFETNGN